MPWDVVNDHPDCPAGRPYAVVKEGGEVEGCHPTEEAAQAQQAALYAAEEGKEGAGAATVTYSSTGTSTTGPIGPLARPRATSTASTVKLAVAETEPPGFAPVAVVLAIEGELTGDGRELAPGSLTWRDLGDEGLPLMFQDKTPAGGMMGNPHEDAVWIGDLLTIERSGSRIVATGQIDLGRPEGAELARILGNGSSLRGVSVDLDAVASKLVTDDGRDVETMPEDELFDLDPATVHELFTQGRIMGATVTPFPAIAGGASIALVTPDDALVASAVLAPELPPAAWYEDPGFAGPTPLTIEATGRLYGHVALWGQPHIGIDGRRVTPPHSPSGYSYFATGAVRARCSDCPAGAVEDVPVGVLTLGGGHAPLSASPEAAMRHYDDVGLAAAFVGIGEDAWGIWVAGTVAPGLSPADVALLRATPPSGDWRPLGGHGLELCALAAVNVQGFPVPRSRVHVGGAPQLALAASGARARATARLDALEARLTRLEAIAAPLAGLALDAYDRELAPASPARQLRRFARRRRS